MNRLHTISELQSEINAMQNLVLYYEGRILKKRIAVLELFTSADCSTDLVPVNQKTKVEAPLKQRTKFALTMTQMIEGVFGGMSGNVFGLPEIKKACLARYPMEAKRIKTQMYTACSTLIERGIIVRVPGGFQTKQGVKA